MPYIIDVLGESEENTAQKLHTDEISKISTAHIDPDIEEVIV